MSKETQQDLEFSVDDQVEGEDPSSQEPTSQNPPSSPTPSDGNDDAGVQTPFAFKHGTLTGKSPEEIEEYVRTLEATTREQGSTLTQLHSQLESQSPSPAPTGAPMTKEQALQELGLSEEDWYNDPIGTQQKIIEHTMARMIRPFQQNLAKTEEERAWDELHSQFPKSRDLRPLMETIMRQQKVSTPNLPQLKSYYFLARGIAAEQGSNVGGDPSGASPVSAPNAPAPSTPPQPPVNPQHPASSHPLKDSSENPRKLRPLTENEERLRRYNNMTHEEFLEFQEEEGPMVMPISSEGGK